MLYTIFFTTFLLSLFGKYAINNKSNNATYYLSMLVPLIFISIMLGARFGWATDYMDYFRIYENKLYENYELLFKGLNDSLHLLNAPFPFAFISYCFLFFLGVIVLLSNFKEVAYISFPLLVYLSFFGCSNLIRFHIALGFVLIAIHYLLNNSWKLFIVFAIFAILTHTGSIILLFAIALIKGSKKTNRILTNIRIIIPLFCVSCLLNAEMFTNIISAIVDLISSKTSLNTLTVSRYLTDSEIQKKYFETIRYETFFNRDKAIYYYFIHVYYLFSILILGNLINKKAKIKNFDFIYSVYVFGCLLTIPFWGNELMMRLTSFFVYFSSIILASGIHLVIKNRIKLVPINLVLLFFSALSFAYLFIYGTIKGLYNDFDILFVWDIII